VLGNLFRLMKPDAKKRLIANIVGSLSNAPKNIQERQVGHFLKADPAYGRGLMKGSRSMSSIWFRRSLCWRVTNVDWTDYKLRSPGVILRGWCFSAPSKSDTVLAQAAL